MGSHWGMMVQLYNPSLIPQRSHDQTHCKAGENLNVLLSALALT